MFHAIDVASQDRFFLFLRSLTVSSKPATAVAGVLVEKGCGAPWVSPVPRFPPEKGITCSSVGKDGEVDVAKVEEQKIVSTACSSVLGSTAATRHLDEQRAIVFKICQVLRGNVPFWEKPKACRGRDMFIRHSPAPDSATTDFV